MSQPRGEARDRARVTDLKGIALNLDLYKGLCHKYPNSLTLTTSNGCPSGTTLGTFINTIPTDPLGTSYGYATSSTGLAYVLRASLETALSALTSDFDGATNNGVSLECSDSPTRYYCLGSL
jgi:hypothetical protein